MFKIQFIKLKFVLIKYVIIAFIFNSTFQEKMQCPLFQNWVELGTELENFMGGGWPKKIYVP
jgi:hypothetical protein